MNNLIVKKKESIIPYEVNSIHYHDPEQYDESDLTFSDGTGHPHAIYEPSEDIVNQIMEGFTDLLLGEYTFIILDYTGKDLVAEYI